jgi:hypothetical protein
LALTPEKPLFGHKSGAKARTHWCTFMKAASTLSRPELEAGTAPHPSHHGASHE